MRKIAFGYSTRCNIRCSHCVAAGEIPDLKKMELPKAKEIIRELSATGVTGISFTAGEPFIYFNDLLEMVGLCRDLGMYTRIVTNSYWARSGEKVEEHLRQLKQQGLCQLRLSFSRWHQQHVSHENVMNAARGCVNNGIDYFISFVTDFSEDDDRYEKYLREHCLKFFPEPVIYAGRAGNFGKSGVFTDYQANCCPMNPYLAPDLNMYACCDAGSHFTSTNFFLLGNLNDHTVNHLFTKNETTPLYNCIRSMGITNIASFAGFKSRDIVTYRKCELCRELFNSPERLQSLAQAAISDLPKWTR